MALTKLKDIGSLAISASGRPRWVPGDQLESWEKALAELRNLQQETNTEQPEKKQK